jgi:hypothetical protein
MFRPPAGVQELSQEPVPVYGQFALKLLITCALVGLFLKM